MLDDIAGRVRALIKSRRPDVCLLLNSNPDVTFHEINNAVDRPLPLWRYHAGDVAKTSRSAHPHRPVAINCVMFWDIPYRFTAEQPGMVQLSLAQVIANGANPYSYVLGHTRNQLDRKNYPAVRRALQFHTPHERWYDGRLPASDVLVVSPAQSEEAYGDRGVALTQAASRGVYRALAESHIPFDVLPDTGLVEAGADGRLGRYRAVVLPNAAALTEGRWPSSTATSRRRGPGGHLRDGHPRGRRGAPGREARWRSSPSGWGACWPGATGSRSCAGATCG